MVQLRKLRSCSPKSTGNLREGMMGRQFILFKENLFATR